MLVFGLKLVLSMTFNLNETYFSEKFEIWRYLTSKSSKKIAQIEVFDHFLDFVLLIFLNFAHNGRWAWCLVVFLQFAGSVNVFVFYFKVLLLDFVQYYWKERTVSVVCASGKHEESWCNWTEKKCWVSAKIQPEAVVRRCSVK